ncbi:MAG: class I SAM-dependent methyltransferase [Candidatus Binatia bacterium]
MMNKQQLFDHSWTFRELCTWIRTVVKEQGRHKRQFGCMLAGNQAQGMTAIKHDSRYWNGVAQPFQSKPHYLDDFLGTLKRSTHLSLIERWGGVPKEGSVLKTDLFEEAVGPDTLLGDLAQQNPRTIGMDVSSVLAQQAASRDLSLGSSYIVADCRDLPFVDAAFTLILSPSTLDHFLDPADLGRSLQELKRILAIDGRLIITLDNRQNIFDPLLRLLNGFGFTPYYIGRSYRIEELCTELEAAGFTIEEKTAILHNPRLVAVALVTLANTLRWPAFTSLVQRSLLAAQRLEHTRWKYFTGSFIAAKAVRRS